MVDNNYHPTNIREGSLSEYPRSIEKNHRDSAIRGSDRQSEHIIL